MSEYASNGSLYKQHYNVPYEICSKSRVERKTMVTRTYFLNPCLGATWTPL